MSLFSSTASLRSSILRGMEENGRRYHGYKEGKYVLPVDEVCFCRLFSRPLPPLLPYSVVEVRHRLWVILLTLGSKNSTGKVSQIDKPFSCPANPFPVFQYDLCLLTFDHILSFAPFTKLNRVLDTGCGVGECGRTSSVSVLGMALS